jgi:hypothetical protein
MRPFAPKKTTSDSGHPGDEELAAYVDGVLGEEDAARVAGHLAACADCYRVYSETLRFQLEEGEEEQEEKVAAAAAARTVVPFPSDRKPKTTWWLAAAAAVLVVGLGAGLFMLLGPASEMTTAELVSPLQGQEDLGPDLWRGRTDRSGGGGSDPEADLFSNERLFQIGVQLVNLQVALEQGNEAASDDVLGRLVSLFSEEPFVHEYEDYYAGVRVAISEEDVPPRSFLQESTAKSEELREFLGSDPYLELGRFVEAGRLAAISREPSFFERRGVRRMLRDLLKQQRKGELMLNAESLRSLQAISERLGKEDLQAADYEALKEGFETILRRYYRPS